MFPFCFLQLSHAMGKETNPYVLNTDDVNGRQGGTVTTSVDVASLLPGPENR